jgi:predicted DNA-binding protein
LANLSITLSEETMARLQALAAEFGCSEAEFAAESIEQWLESVDDLRIAEDRLDKIRDGHSSSYTLKEVERELGLAD